MAILQKIRNRAGIFVIIFVGVALFLFIIDPTTFQSLFQKKDTDIAEINGKDVGMEEFNELYRARREYFGKIYQRDNFNADEERYISEMSWNDLIQKYVLEPFYEELGLSVSDAEMEDLLFGSNIHRMLFELPSPFTFKDAQTGAIDTAGIRSFFADERFASLTDFLKSEIMKNRMMTKYSNMVAKGFYVPKKLAELDYTERNTMFDFEYFFRPYKSIPDESIKLAEADYKTYYDAHQYMFKQEKASRDIEYIVFDIVPSAEDSSAVRTDIKELHTDFVGLSEGYLEFAKAQSDIENREIYLNQDSMPMGLTEEFFNGEIGTTTDIILSNNAYYFTRIIDIASRPDSAQISHIYIRPNDSTSMEVCLAKADSLKILLDKGGDFATIAVANSDHPLVEQNGGNIDWITDGSNLQEFDGLFIPEFNDACFKNKKGDIVVVESQYGVHLIKISDQTKPVRKVKLATIAKEIHYSEKTANFVYSVASSFAAQNTTAQKFDAAAAKDKRDKRIVTDLDPLTSRIDAIEDVRDLVRWVYAEGTSKGSISAVHITTDKYIIIKVSAVREKGTLPLADVKSIIQPIILKNKKADLLMAELNKDVAAKVDMVSMATKYNTQVDTVNNFNFSAFNMPGVGAEPNVNAVVANSGLNVVSKPIKGNSGVFVVRVINSVKAPAKTDYSAEQIGMMRNQASQVQKIFETIIKKAKIEDYRGKFF